MRHDDAVALLSACPCPCHQGAGSCWCTTREPDDLAICHNDRVAHFGRCDGHAGLTGPCPYPPQTSPEMRSALTALENRARDQRICSGRVRPSDINHIAKHPHRYPTFFRRNP